MAQRILTGKQEKVDPVQKKIEKEKRLNERFDFERQQLRCGSGNNYEIIYPSLYEEDKNKKAINMLNSQLDTHLRGLGFGGAVTSMSKDVFVDLYKRIL